ncbi:hypothetical protein E3J62_04830 [candidate division TA06 bacterium]|uniref:SbsA Ig-like domain-containing protein n=1 Tax=candidate division TA06 bacterium TaxID=2250710 RepID=A0A523UUS4_UNCT6|nr:MAG: hypothetical protein E3J62_04830 [candidate division TA06 bacterium]
MRKILMPILAGVFVWPGFVSGDDWPLKPFGEQHQINSTFAEYRTGHFHQGVDIEPFGGGSSDSLWLVYSVLSDTAYHTNGANPGVRVGKYYYIHLTNRVDDATYIAAFEDTIGRIQASKAHLHFHWTSRYPPIVDTVFNPLWPSGLSPYVDSTNPHIDSILFYRQGFADSLLSDTLGPDTLERKVDILCVAGDFRTDTLGHCPTPDSGNVSVYRIEYEVRRILSDTTDTLLRSWQKITFDTIPNPSDTVQLNRTYGPGSSSSHFRYWVSNDPFNPDSSKRDWYWNTKQKDSIPSLPDSVDAESVDVAKFPRGNYRVKVFAYDIGGNSDVDSVQVYVDNFGPRVDSVFPADSATNVPIGTNIEVKFNEPMDQNVTLNSVITFSPGASVSWQWLDSTKVRGTPNPSLEPGTNYSVTIHASVGSDSLTDIVGHLFDGDRNGVPGGDYQWSFETGDSDTTLGWPIPPPMGRCENKP